VSHFPSEVNPSDTQTDPLMWCAINVAPRLKMPPKMVPSRRDLVPRASSRSDSPLRDAVPKRSL